MRRLVVIALITGLASVLSACGAGTASEGTRHPARATTSTSSTAAPTTTSTTPTTTEPPSTSAPPEPTSTAPAPATTAAPAAEPAPASAGNGQLPDASLTTVTPSCRILNGIAPRL